MRRRSILNGLLSLNALLMAGVLWSQLSGRPLLADQASAFPGGGNPALAPAIPNASEQRQRIVDEIRTLRSSVDALKAAVQSGTYRVEVTNFSELKLDSKN